MKRLIPLVSLIILLSAGCVTQKKLAYLGPTPKSGDTETFPVDVLNYRLKNKDVLYITIKAMGPDGTIKDFLGGSMMGGGINITQGGGNLYGYEVNSEGNLILPAIGTVKVVGLTLDEARVALQPAVDKVFKNATVECKLFTFSYTVIGEVNGPGTKSSQSNYLTILEALGNAGGLKDIGNRDKVLVVRQYQGGTKTFRVSLRDNNIFASEAYSILPNDVIIVEPMKQKLLFLNLATLSSIVGIITTTFLVINLFK